MKGLNNLDEVDLVENLEASGPGATVSGLKLDFVDPST